MSHLPDDQQLATHNRFPACWRNCSHHANRHEDELTLIHINPNLINSQIDEGKREAQLLQIGAIIEARYLHTLGIPRLNKTRSRVRELWQNPLSQDWEICPEARGRGREDGCNRTALQGMG